MKISKKLTAVALASVLAISTAVSAFAAESPSKAAVAIDQSKATVDADGAASVKKVTTTAAGNATITSVANKASVTIGSSVNVGGVNYKVTKIGAKAFGKKTTKVTVNKKIKKLTIANNAFKGSKIKTLNLKKVTTVKLTKKNLAGLKKGCKIVLSAKNYKTYAAKLKKWGYKPAKK